MSKQKPIDDGGLARDMTLCDRFAEKALNEAIRNAVESGEPPDMRIIAIMAYDMADAMIAEKRRREA